MHTHKREGGLAFEEIMDWKNHNPFKYTCTSELVVGKVKVLNGQYKITVCFR